ncbi:MAG: hypothetical protein ACM3PP_09315, partial [Candidatus Saccharibacteria bacterium]
QAVGFGKIRIDEKVVADYLKMTRQKSLDRRIFKEVVILDLFPSDRLDKSKSLLKGLGVVQGL